VVPLLLQVLPPQVPGTRSTTGRRANRRQEQDVQAVPHADGVGRATEASEDAMSGARSAARSRCPPMWVRWTGWRLRVRVSCSALSGAGEATPALRAVAGMVLGPGPCRAPRGTARARLTGLVAPKPFWSAEAGGGAEGSPRERMNRQDLSCTQRARSNGT